MMRAVMACKPGELCLGELEIPVPGDYEALLRMEACAICNSTDHKLINNEFFPGTFPIVLGHEVIGTVVETGPRVVNFKPGDRVFRQRLGDQHVPGVGRSCWGGFAEYGLVSDEWARQSLPYDPKVLPHDQQKLLIDVAPELATTMVTLMETLDCITTCGARPGKSVAIVGSGPVGQAFAMFAKLLGAGPVIGFGRQASHAGRFAAIAHSDGYITGADNPPEVERLIQQGGFDLVMEAVGSAAALDRAIGLAGSRGGVFVYGIPPESGPYRKDQLAFPRLHNVGAKEGRVQAELVRLVEAGKVRLEDWFDVCLPMAAYAQAFDLVFQKQANKAVLKP